MKNIYYLWALTWLCAPGTWAITSDEYGKVIKEIAAKIQSSNTTGKPQRLAVVTFVPTKADAENKNEFGEYITESLISALGSTKQFRLFERRRLDAVLKENALMMSDLMNSEQAQKVGELIPIDVLFSGTYTKLKNYIDVNCRLIDVITGEIYFSFSGSIAMTADLASLFPGEHNVATASTAISEAERCKQNADLLKQKLNDLTTPSKIQSAVDEAVRISFDTECGKVHYDVLYVFTRYKIQNTAYKKFLIQTLGGIANPDQDDRTKETIRYFAADSVIDEEEWRIGLETITRMRNYRLYICLNLLFPTDDLRFSPRVDAYLNRALDNKIGLPKPISFNHALDHLADGFKDTPALMSYAYKNYQKHIQWDSQAQKDIYALLNRLYQTSPTAENKRQALDWLSEYFHRFDASDDIADRLFDFIRQFRLTTNAERNKEITAVFPESDLKYFANKTSERIAANAPKTPYKSQKDERIDFCLWYDIAVPGIIPTMDEAKVILSGKDNWDEQLQTLLMIEKMGMQPKPLESQLIAIFSKRNLEHKETLTEMQSSAIVTLGHLKTSDPAAIDFMMASLMSYDYRFSDNAKTALVQIGKSAVPKLTSKLQSLTDQDGGLMYSIAEILGKIGPDARSAKTVLQQSLGKTNNSDVRYAIESALQAIEGQ
ncbi:hypothetical protein L6Q79_09365 [bacterium]|nr:hypothetical protein [bacterium]NUN45216.1 hypothetical protein [bacterium]